MSGMALAGEPVEKHKGLQLLIAATTVTVAVAFYVSPLSVGVFAAALVLVLAAFGFRPLLWLIIFFLPIAPYLTWDLPIKDLATLVRFALFGGTIVFLLRRRVRLRSWLLRGKLTWGVIAYFVAAVLSATVFNQGTGAAARELMRLASYLCFYYAITAWVKSDEDFTHVFSALMLSTVCVTAFGFYQSVIGDYSAVYQTLYPFQDEVQKAPEWSGRITSFLGHFNSLAGYLNLEIPLFIALGLGGRSEHLRRRARVCFVLSSAALVLTQSRGALLAYAAMLLLAAWVFAPNRRARVRWISSLAAMTSVAALIVGSIFQRLSGIDQYTQITRLAVWAGAGTVFTGSPVGGIGFGNLRTLLAGFIDLPDDFILDAHSLYLELLAETGVIGFLAFAWLMFIALRSSWRLLGDGRGTMAVIIGFTSLAAIFGVLVHGLVDYMFHTSPQFSAMFFLILGLLNAATGKRDALVEEHGPS
jgi:putative inorganic carbon (hco3(-)) transporter